MARPDGMDLMYGFESQGQNALTGLGNLQSAFSGINTAQDARQRYGIKDVNSMFDPLFKSLASNRARRMQGAAARAGRSASPEMSFSNVESDYEQGLQGLLGNKEQADWQQQQFVANLLGNAQGANNQFGLQKYMGMGNLASGLMQNRLGLEQFNREGEGPGFWDIAGSILGTGAKVAGSALGAPKSVANYYTTNPTA